MVFPFSSRDFSYRTKLAAGSASEQNSVSDPEISFKNLHPVEVLINIFSPV